MVRAEPWVDHDDLRGRVDVTKVSGSQLGVSVGEFLFTVGVPGGRHPVPQAVRTPGGTSPAPGRIGDRGRSGPSVWVMLKAEPR